MQSERGPGDSDVPYILVALGTMRDLTARGKHAAKGCRWTVSPVLADARSCNPRPCRGPELEDGLDLCGSTKSHSNDVITLSLSDLPPGQVWPKYVIASLEKIC